MTTVEPRRPYDSALRRQQAAQTRARIVRAGAELLRSSPVRDWNTLTIRAVAARAGVHERTVYRHFGNELALRDAVLHRLEEQAGIELEGMRIEDVADVTARILGQVASFRPEPPRPLDPTLLEAKGRQHDALAGAVAGAAPEWGHLDRRIAAAVLDVLWGVATYERLVVDWELDHAETVRALSWVIGLVEEAVRRDRRPD